MVGNRNAHCDLVNWNFDDIVGKRMLTIKGNANIMVSKQNGGNVEVLTL